MPGAEWVNVEVEEEDGLPKRFFIGSQVFRVISCTVYDKSQNIWTVITARQHRYRLWKLNGSWKALLDEEPPY